MLLLPSEQMHCCFRMRLHDPFLSKRAEERSNLSMFFLFLECCTAALCGCVVVSPGKNNRNLLLVGKFPSLLCEAASWVPTSEKELVEMEFFRRRQICYRPLWEAN